MNEATIEIALPSLCTVLVYRSTLQPGVWIIKACVDAIDVKTGEPGLFMTTWQDEGEPNRGDIAQAVIDMLAHEVFEQLGLEPHERAAMQMPDTPR